jgi:group I intron endonuclease
MKTNILSLVATKCKQIRKGSLIYSLFPINYRTKYPIFFESLLNRINNLNKNYNKLSSVSIYKDVKLNRKKINKDLENKGGIYLWWCPNTGLFYIGSAKAFVGKNGRLNDYFQKNRLLNIVKPKISRDLAKDLIKYPISGWNLVILEVLNSQLEIEKLKEKEQFWMLLIPTYNRSLVVGSNDGIPMTEQKRQSLSTLIYTYEISNEGKLILDSEQIIFGLKELSRIGLKSKFSNFSTTANYWDVQAYLKSGLPFKNKFILTKTPLNLESQLSWKQTTKNDIENKKNFQKKKDKRIAGVWVYDFNSLNFIEYLDSVKLCREKYKIPSTTFKRLRTHGLNYNGYLFSNYEK